ncbi:MAG: hypothetical protein KAW09_03135, partial [Thermoplasmata archaeon]|nr:hypothetical protein [Thermoplasmata archaeon]
MNYGRPLGMVGGILALVGCVLPWMTISDAVNSVSASGLQVFIFGVPAMIFGILGLVFVAIPKKGFYLTALIMGILVMVFAILAITMTSVIAGLAAYSGVVTVSIDYGMYLTLVGSILLMIGGALAYVQYEEVPAPVPVQEIPPYNGQM